MPLREPAEPTDTWDEVYKSPHVMIFHNGLLEKFRISIADGSVVFSHQEFLKISEIISNLAEYPGGLSA